MAKTYIKIVSKNGYTKVYDEDGKELKNIKSIKFEHASVDNVPIAVIEKYVPTYKIEGDIKIATLDMPISNA